jgi:molybdenum cofactor cytidylyltransferase
MLRSFAIVPAAGRSLRMGAQKLMLPLGGRPLIDRVLAAWTASGVTRTLVVVRRDDEELASVCQRFDVDLVHAAAPPADMKASVLLALEHIAERYAPESDEAWLVAPADLPGLSPAVVDRVLAEYAATAPLAVIPTFAGRRGHPAALAWSSAAAVGRLPMGAGVNSVVGAAASREVALAERYILDDVDDPVDYARAVAALELETAEAGAGFSGRKTVNR